jgi:hypothetical protein
VLWCSSCSGASRSLRAPHHDEEGAAVGGRLQKRVTIQPWGSLDAMNAWPGRFAARHCGQHRFGKHRSVRGMIEDLSALAATVSVIGGPIMFVTAPGRAAAISLRAQRELPFPVLGSPAVAPNDVLDRHARVGERD